jgi:hypothetical protein
LCKVRFIMEEVIMKRVLGKTQYYRNDLESLRPT